jgi:hypothetical protein
VRQRSEECPPKGRTTFGAEWIGHESDQLTECTCSLSGLPNESSFGDLFVDTAVVGKLGQAVSASAKAIDCTLRGSRGMLQNRCAAVCNSGYAIQQPVQAPKMFAIHLEFDDQL